MSGPSLGVVTRAGCSVRVAKEHTRSGGSPIRILIGVDGSRESESAVLQVCRRSWPETAEYRVIGVFESLSPPLTETDSQIAAIVERSNEQQRQWLRNACQAAVTTLRNGGLNAGYVVLEGDPKQILIEEADKWKADSIFVGARGLSRLERLFLGRFQRRSSNVRIARSRLYD